MSFFSSVIDFLTSKIRFAFDNCQLIYSSEASHDSGDNSPNHSPYLSHRANGYAPFSTSSGQAISLVFDEFSLRESHTGFWDVHLRKIIILFGFQLIFQTSTFSQETYVYSDLQNFIRAYERFSSTNDTTLQKKYLREYFLDQESTGMHSLREARNYTEQEYLKVIRAYPNFWNSLLKQLESVHSHFPEIDHDIAQLKQLYPSLQPATIYFTLGAFRSGGTIDQYKVLIGCELSLLDESIDLSELPAFTQNFVRDFQPKKNLALTITHEYVHTQQKLPLDNLLSYCIYEGIAEYVSCLATKKVSNTPAISFGQTHQNQVFQVFEEDIFDGNIYNWLWGENDNELKVRDLGYYIGYAIAEKHYQNAEDRPRAVQELIELDYADLKQVERIVDGTKLLSKTLNELEREYELNRPQLVSFQLNGKNKRRVSPGIAQLKLQFSETMDSTMRGFDYGPNGPDQTFILVRSLGWNEYRTTYTCEIEVQPKQHYSTWVTSGFRSSLGKRLRPKLIQFKTKSK